MSTAAGAGRPSTTWPSAPESRNHLSPLCFADRRRSVRRAATRCSPRWPSWTTGRARRPRCSRAREPALSKSWSTTTATCRSSASSAACRRHCVGRGIYLSVTETPLDEPEPERLALRTQVDGRVFAAEPTNALLAGWSGPTVVAGWRTTRALRAPTSSPATTNRVGNWRPTTWWLWVTARSGISAGPAGRRSTAASGIARRCGAPDSNPASSPRRPGQRSRTATTRGGSCSTGFPTAPRFSARTT